MGIDAIGPTHDTQLRTVGSERGESVPVMWDEVTEIPAGRFPPAAVALEALDHWLRTGAPSAAVE